MAFCRECGEKLEKGAKFCPKCGAAIESAPVFASAEPAPLYQAEKPKKKRKPLLRRWWFWVLAVIMAANLVGRIGLKRAEKLAPGPTAPVSTLAPKATEKPTPAPTAAPTQEPAADTVPESAQAPEPEPTAVAAESEIRPEFKVFLDSYEAFMDEYAAFMKKYKDADAASTVSMMGDYYDILKRYAEFAEKIDALDEREMTNAELAYYIEVTSRVSQKLLTAAG